MIYLRSATLQLAASERLSRVLVPVPGTRDCLRATVPHLALQTHEGTRVLPVLVCSLLIEYGRLPEPDNLRLQHLCDTPDCVCPDHWRKMPALRAGRIHAAQTPDDMVPPAARRPLTARSQRQLGARNGSVVLTEEQARRILFLRYVRKMTYSAIAAEVGAKMRTVASACNGHNWRFLWVRHPDGRVTPPLADIPGTGS